MKSVLRYAFDNYYSDMSLIDFRKEVVGRKLVKSEALNG